MRDINVALRTAYADALSGIGFPLYYKQAPDNETAPLYVVVDNISNTDNSTMNSAEVTAGMRVTIHSYSPTYNTGLEAAGIADNILQAIKGTPTTQLNATGIQIGTTKLVSDTEQAYNIQNTRNYLDRVIIFEHKIYIN